MAGGIDKSISPEAQMAINIDVFNRLVASMRLAVGRLNQSETGEALDEDVEEEDQLVWLDWHLKILII